MLALDLFWLFEFFFSFSFFFLAFYVFIFFHVFYSIFFLWMSTWVVETISGQPITEKQEQKQTKKRENNWSQCVQIKEALP